MIEPESFAVKVNDQESVTALLYSAAKKDRAGFTVVLGHGAGANQLSGFMRMVASGLAARGIDAMTFNFLYTERGRTSHTEKRNAPALDLKKDLPKSPRPRMHDHSEV